MSLTIDDVTIASHTNFSSSILGEILLGDLVRVYLSEFGVDSFKGNDLKSVTIYHSSIKGRSFRLCTEQRNVQTFLKVASFAGYAGTVHSDYINCNQREVPIALFPMYSSEDIVAQRALDCHVRLIGCIIIVS